MLQNSFILWNANEIKLSLNNRHAFSKYKTQFTIINVSIFLIVPISVLKIFQILKFHANLFAKNAISTLVLRNIVYA